MARPYTRGGAGGETGRVGSRASKDAPLVEALGNLGELNAALGRAHAEADGAALRPQTVHSAGRHTSRVRLARGPRHLPVTLP